MNLRILSTLLLLSMLVFSRPAHAADSYSGCTGVIKAPLPVTITTPGTWCVEVDYLSLASGAGSNTAITIAADNVTIDCNHFWILGQAGGQTGIYLKDHFNDKVRNCGLAQFATGIQFDATTNLTGGRNVIEDNVVDNNYAFGIRTAGDDTIVRRNQVTNMGRSGWSGFSAALVYGIYAVNNAEISGNMVSNLVPNQVTNGSVYGIYTSKSTQGVIENNRVNGLTADGTGKVFGITNASSGRIVIRDNDVLGTGAAGSIGMSCSSASGWALHNMIGGFATALQLCGNAGDNDLIP